MERDIKSNYHDTESYIHLHFPSWGWGWAGVGGSGGGWRVGDDRGARERTGRFSRERLTYYIHVHNHNLLCGFPSV